MKLVKQLKAAGCSADLDIDITLADDIKPKRYHWEGAAPTYGYIESMRDIQDARDWTYKGLVTYVACALRREFDPVGFAAWKLSDKAGYTSDADWMTALMRFTYGVDCVRRWRQWRPNTWARDDLNYLPSFVWPDGSLFKRVQDGAERAAECIDMFMTEEKKARRGREGLIANPLRRESYRTNAPKMYAVRGLGL